MIILVTGWFPQYERGIPTGKKEFLVSHGVDLTTGRDVVLPCEPPSRIKGAYFDKNYNEWAIAD
jgi:hypothetical protein